MSSRALTYVAPKPEELEARIGKFVWRQINRSAYNLTPVIGKNDLYQVVMLTLLERLPQYDPKKGAFTTWAATWIRQAIAREHLRRSWRYTKDPIPGRTLFGFGPMAVAGDEDEFTNEIESAHSESDDLTTVEVDDFLGSIGDDLDRAIAACLLKEMTEQQIVGALSISITTVRNATKRLQERLTHYLNLEGEL